MSPVTSPRKQNIRETIQKRSKVRMTDTGSAGRLGNDLTCNEADVDALLSDGEST
jgi:hypothetical protein